MNDVPTLQTDKVTLAGDLMKFILDEVKQAQEPWEKLPQAQQDEVIERIEKQSRHSIERAVEIVLAEGFPIVECKLEEVKFKKSVKLALTARRDEKHKHDLVDSEGEYVTLVLLNKEQYTGGPKSVKSDPDEPELEFVGDDPSEYVDVESEADPLIEEEIIHTGPEKATEETEA